MRRTLLIIMAAAGQLARARLATGRYALNLHAAKFDVTKPAILVYERRGRSWQLGALEWVFTQTPAAPALPGATYGSFPGACHYQDGTFAPPASRSCAPSAAPRPVPRSTSGTPIG